MIKCGLAKEIPQEERTVTEDSDTRVLMGQHDYVFRLEFLSEMLVSFQCDIDTR